MTPMIDIVFQLLIFFIMTFKIIAPEGDFNIKMPLNAPSEGLPDDNQLPPMKVRLRATASGRLASIQLGQRTLPDFKALQMQGPRHRGRRPGPRLRGRQHRGRTGLRLPAPLRVRYRRHHRRPPATWRAMGQSIVKLIEKIKFAPPRTGILMTRSV